MRMFRVRNRAAKPQHPGVCLGLVAAGIRLGIRGRSSGHKLRFMGVLWVASCAGILLDGCAPEGPAPLLGTYVGNYANGATEVLVIREDGTYSQRLSRAGQVVYENTGTWELDGRIVTFHDVMIGFQKKDPPDFDPRHRDFLMASWNPRKGTIMVSLYSELRKQEVKESAGGREEQ